MNKLLLILLLAFASQHIHAQRSFCGCEHLTGTDSMRYARFMAGGEAARKAKSKVAAQE